jgi:polyhydroxybutyrate depolymerase
LRLRILKIAALIVASVVALGALAYAYFIYSPSIPPHLSGQASNLVVDVDGKPRSYVAYVPAQLPKGGPLLVVLHGTVMTGAMMRQWTGYEFDALADKEHFAVVYPDGIGRSWNDCLRGGDAAKKQNADDVGFVRTLVSVSRDEFGSDVHRVFALGYSNGGQMVFRILSDAPGLLAGAAIAGANLPAPSNNICRAPSKIPPMIITAGTKDPISPYAGGEVTIPLLGSRGSVLSARATAARFGGLAGITTAPTAAQLPHREANDQTSVTSLTLSRGGQPYIILYSVLNGGHVVPQPSFRFPRLLGATTLDLDIPLEANAFLNFDRVTWRLFAVSLA